MELTEKAIYKNGISYVRLGDDFKDSRNVYVGNPPERVGSIIFVLGKKPVYDGHNHRIRRYVDGFVFEIENEVSISCNDFKKIAKHVYDLNQHYKEMKNKNG